jgi:hypothetical protein
MNISALLKSFIKSATVAAVGLLVPLGLALTSGAPTGGFAVYLEKHPTMSLAFGLLAMFIHDYLSQIQKVPVQQIVATDTVVPVKDAPVVVGLVMSPPPVEKPPKI